MNSTSSSTLQIGRLPATMASLGTLVDYFSRIEPFSRYDVGNFSHALQYQLETGRHLAAFAGLRIIGYMGWLSTTEVIASRWVEDGGQLNPTSDGEAIALTVVAASNHGVLRALIRQARQLNPGRRVHFKRRYAGIHRPSRKASLRPLVGKL